MVRLKHNNMWTYVESDSDQEIELIESCLTWTEKGARFSKAYIERSWDGKKSLFYYKQRTFPTGLLPYITKKLLSKNIDFEILDKRPLQIKINPKKPELNCQLRDYQSEAVSSFLAHERGILRMSTRSGKTLVGIALTHSLGVPTLFVVHSKDLLHQTAKEYEEKSKGNTKIGKIGDGEFDLQHITIALINSLARKCKKPDNTFLEFIYTRRFVIWDEVHRASKSYQDVSRMLKNADYRLGLSATALMNDKGGKLQTQAICGPIIYEANMKELLDKDRIAKPRVYFIPLFTKISMGDWNDVYSEGIVNNETRNLIIATVARRLVKIGRRVLILIEKIQHGRNLQDLLKEKLNSHFVSGIIPSNERKILLEKLQSGGIDVLIATRIFNEGIDIPELDAVIIGGGYKSIIQSYQKYGRGITKTQSKVDTIIVDFLDQGNSLLNKHSEERINVCENDDAFEVKVVPFEELEF